ncbi:unnamed protein product [Musa acuminata subsp. malaccensis]|uniref:(wild Malaysian banana) hypothetical protein n=1 Tax=Musa acuminata subsp. malaccensis TaxID=214687 RepID=A0A804HRI0_MUSAM|nr:unnamed protein product [Musa acuminata subsp. malaccensis]
MHLVRSHGTTFIEPLVSCPRSLYIRTPASGVLPSQGLWLLSADPSIGGALPWRNHVAQGRADLPWRSCVPVLPVFFWQIFEFVVFLMVTLDSFSGAYDHVSWIRSSVDDCSCSMDFVDRTSLFKYRGTRTMGRFMIVRLCSPIANSY